MIYLESAWSVICPSFMFHCLLHMASKDEAHHATALLSGPPQMEIKKR